MKSLSARLQVHKLDDVQVALANIGILGMMTITERVICSCTQETDELAL